MLKISRISNGVMGPQMMQDFREQASKFGADLRYGFVTDIKFDAAL